LVEPLVVPEEFMSPIEPELELDMLEPLPDVLPLLLVPLVVPLVVPPLVPLLIPLDIVLLVPLSVPVPLVLPVVLQPNNARLRVSTAMRVRTALCVRFIVLVLLRFLLCFSRSGSASLGVTYFKTQTHFCAR
jgi:hypothetical protein